MAFESKSSCERDLTSYGALGEIPRKRVDKNQTNSSGFMPGISTHFAVTHLSHPLDLSKINENLTEINKQPSKI